VSLKFYARNPYVTAGMARLGCATLSDLADLIDLDVLDLAEWLSGTETYDDVDPAMAWLAESLGLTIFELMHPCPDPGDVTPEDREDTEWFGWHLLKECHEVMMNITDNPIR
jgi:hypothetical protein